MKKVAEWVDDLPGDIDGMKTFKIKCLPGEWVKKTHDLRFFKMHSLRRKGLIGTRKAGRYIGKFYCLYDNCPFKLLASIRWNTSNFQNVDGHKICFSCGHVVNRQWCGAQKNDRVLQGVCDSYHLPHRYTQVSAKTKHQEIQA